MNMDDERPVDGESAAEIEGDDDTREYEIQDMETEDLDSAMRDALEAVERSEEQLEEAASRVVGAELTETVGDLDGLQAELAELRARSVRTLADFDNYRKRVARERREERRYAASDLALDVLDVVDNLERALAAEGDAADLKQGVGMILQQLRATLSRHGIQQVAALGERFDPALHEAVMRTEDEEVEEPTVREELQSGYALHDRLLRPAMVRVAVPIVEPMQRHESQEPETD